MNFILEEIDLSKVKQLYFLRGYENKDDDHYCTSLVLVGDHEDEYMVELFQSKKTLTMTNGKELLKYLKKTGLSCSAKVLKEDADKFYNSRSFKRIKV